MKIQNEKNIYTIKPQKHYEYRMSLKRGKWYVVWDVGKKFTGYWVKGRRDVET